MPSLRNFSALIPHCDYTKWRKIADSLKVELSMSKLSGKLEGDKFKDQKAFLRVLAKWRVEAVDQGRKANWRNFRKALANFDDIVNAVEKIKQG